MLMSLWKDFVSELAVDPSYIVAGSQAIYVDHSWTVDAQKFLDDESMQLANIGFAKQKITQLTNHYMNVPSIKRASSDLDARIKKRKYGSGVWNFHNNPKLTTKQDYCLGLGVISLYPKKPLPHTRIHIYYRTVELIFRFRADLLFLRDVILPQFDLDTYPPDTITLHFANSTIHPMFGVFLLMELGDKAEEFLYSMCESNTSMGKQWLRWTLIHMNEGYRSYMTALRVQKHVANIYPTRLKSLKKLCETVQKQTGLG